MADQPTEKPVLSHRVSQSDSETKTAEATGDVSPAVFVVMVTGSRDWTDVKAIHGALESVHVPAGHTGVLVHGACRSGADAIANEWAVRHNWTIRTYQAQWRDNNGQIDYSAGPRRNKAMVVEARPHIVLAFRRLNSKGTSDAIRHAMSESKKLTSRTRLIEVYDQIVVDGQEKIQVSRINRP